MTNEELRDTLPHFDIIEGEVVLKPDGMCVHSALVDELEMKLTRALKLLAVWHDAFGAECYNDTLTANDEETESFLLASTAAQTSPRTCIPPVAPAKSTF